MTVTIAVNPGRAKLREGHDMNVDKLEVEILPDGTVKISTDTISTANHLGADQLFAFLGRLLGGETISHPKAQAHRHTHRGQQARH
jgi:hypothetical protein